jgi:hypothetical protein
MAWQTCGCVLRRLCEAAINPCGVVQPVRPHRLRRRGAPGRAVAPRELCQGIDEDEVEAMKIFLGRVWSRDGVELTLQPQVVEVVGLSAPRSLCLIGMQTKVGHRLDDEVNVGW